jgi:hypothetical protein
LVIKIKIWAPQLKVAPFFYIKFIQMSENDNENLRPSKMRGVAFPKAKYGVIAAIIIIVIVNILYYKDALLTLIK